MSPGEVTRFPQTNASLKVPSLGTVESILSETDESIFAKPRARSQFQKVFEAIEITLQAQENHIVSQDTEMAGLHAKIADLNNKIMDLNEHIVKMSMTSSGHSANKTKKSVIADPDIFKGDKLDNKKNQEHFQTFSAQVELKMIGDGKCFENDREKILYVASRVSAPAYKNIKPWVTPVIESKEGGFNNWEELLDVLRRVYDVADKRAAAEREMATLQQKNLPFIQFLAQFNMLLGDLSWDNAAKVSALKARINDELSQALIPVIQTPEHNDFDGWINLLVKLADNAEAYAQRKRPHFTHTTHTGTPIRQQPPSHPRLSTDVTVTQMGSPNPMELDAIHLHPAERIRRLQSSLCLYCGKPGHFKGQCTEAAATRGRGRVGYRGAPIYRGAPRGGYQRQVRGGTYNRAISWEQDPITPDSSISQAMTPISTPTESVVGDLKDQSSA